MTLQLSFITRPRRQRSLAARLLGLCFFGCNGEQARAIPEAAQGAPEVVAPMLEPPSSSATPAPDPGDAPQTSCGPSIGRGVCDPISAWPCDLAGGETCDFSHQLGGFQCLPPPNDAKFCDACDNTAGPYCGAGTTCGPNGWCERYCCADADCRIGTCVRGGIDDLSAAVVGYCEEEGQVTCGGESPDSAASP